MRNVFYVIASALIAPVPGVNVSAEPGPRVAATVTVIRDMEPGEKLMFMSRKWLNQSGAPCKIFIRRSDDNDDTTIGCKGLRPVSFNLKDFPQDPIVIIRVGITRHDAAVGVNN